MTPEVQDPLITALDDFSEAIDRLLEVQRPKKTEDQKVNEYADYMIRKDKLKWWE